MASRYEDFHNTRVLKTLDIGDLVEFPRSLYSHWGVYIGSQQIVHLAGIGNARTIDASNSGSLFSVCGENFEKACVKIDDFFKVARGCKARRNNGKDAKCVPFCPEVIVRKAHSMVGEIGYNLIWNNCEHLASYIRYGKTWSEQVDRAAEVSFWAGAATVVAFIARALCHKSEKE